MNQPTTNPILSRKGACVGLLVELYSLDNLEIFVGLHFDSLRGHVRKDKAYHLAMDLVEAVESRGQLARLFVALCAERELRVSEIAAIAELWTGRLAIRTLPREAGLWFKGEVVTLCGLTKTWEKRTDGYGSVVLELPAGQLRIPEPNGTMRTLELRPGETKTHVHSSDKRGQRVVQFSYAVVDYLANHRRRAAMFVAAVAAASFAGWQVKNHLAACPPDMVYVPPIAYHVGFETRDDGSIPDKLIKVLASQLRRNQINADLIIESLFRSKARSLEIPAFALDETEVTVGRYKAHLDTLAEDAAKEMTPGAWSSQTDESARIRGDAEKTGKPSEDIPVHSVSWEQARNYCLAQGGDLPTHEQREIAARNLGLVASKEQHGTLYPWGDTWMNDLNTRENSLRRVAPACSTGDRNRSNVCNLGDNLREWVRENADDAAAQSITAGGGTTHNTGGAWWGDDGQLGAVGFVFFPQFEVKSAAAIGFRCASPNTTSMTSSYRVAFYARGTYHVGIPEDNRLEILENGKSRAVYILNPDEELPNVGDFFISNKITNAQYDRFLITTERGHGPWDVRSGSPQNYSYVIQSGGRPDAPARGVSYFDAFAYCASVDMRLPTAEEWERTVRGGSQNHYPWGLDVDGYEAFKQDPGRDATFIRGMWSTGPEWTSTEGWDPDEEERILKGLLTEDNLPGSSQDPRDFYAVLRLPKPLADKISNATFRCVKDRTNTGLLESLGLEPRSTSAPLQWPLPAQST